MPDPASFSKRARHVFGSFGHRLTIVVFSAVLIATTLVLSVLVWQQAHSYAAQKRASLTGTARVFAAATASAVARKERAEAAAALRAIARLAGVTYAGVADLDGVLLAEAGMTARLDTEASLDLALEADESAGAWDMVRRRSLSVVVPVVEGGVAVGRLMLIADAADFFEQVGAMIRTSLTGALAALALALPLTWPLRGSITRPVRGLLTITEQIASTHDYTRRIAHAGDDELGRLVTQFNTMLTEISMRDAAISRHTMRLEATVEERTRDLSVAKQAAETANAAKSDFLATMSHEIRTPLNGLIVVAEMLSRGELNAQARRYAQVMERSSRSLLAIINDILDLSKMESGKLEVERIAADPVEIVDNVLMLFAEKAREKGLDLAAVAASGLPRTVATDPVRLSQVLGNLVNNALKFTETGGVRIDVAFQALPAGGQLRLAVADTGIGIAPDKLATVFESFTQADQTTTRRFGGTGLGLTISRRIVEAMGGAITVESEPGVGTTFSVLIPLSRADVGGARTPARLRGAAFVDVEGPATRASLRAHLSARGFGLIEEGGAGAPEATLLVATPERLSRRLGSVGGAAPPQVLLIGAAAPGLLPDGVSAAALDAPLSLQQLDALLDWMAEGRPLSGFGRQARVLHAALPSYPARRVLVVDDNALNREIATEALAQFGVVVSALESGAEAVAAVAAQRYDLVLMDGSMPGMDGYEAARRIRVAEARQGGARTPIVALTAHVIGRVADAWRGCGMDGVLHKPFTLEQLGDLMARFLGEGERAPAGARPPEHAPEAEGLIAAETLAQWRRFEAAGKAAFVARLWALYEEHGLRTVAELQEARAGGDVGQVRERAHALKSMSLNMGAIPAADQAAAIEAAASEGRLSPNADLARLKATFCATLEARPRWIMTDSAAAA